MIDFIVYGVPLLLAGIGIIAFIFDRFGAVWLTLTKSKPQDEADRAALPTFERLKTEMFGTEREKAVEKLKGDFSHLKTLGGCILVQLVFLVFIYGIVSLWRDFQSK